MQDFFLTQGLSGQQAAEVEATLPAARTYAKGEIIYSEENYFNAVGLILSGSVTVKTAETGAVVMRTLSKGAVFGAAAVFSEDERFISRIYAAKTCEILFLSEDTLRTIFAKYPQTAVNYIRLMSSKIRFLNRKIGILACKSTHQRVYEYLLSLCSDEGVAVLPKMTAICKILGIGRSSLYRSMELLSGQGLIEKNDRMVRVIGYEKNC